MRTSRKRREGGRGSSRRGGRKGRKPPSRHDGPDERWMASYMDMVTVLMCLFIVLYAMSTVDQDKFAALKNSLATGFGVETIQHRRHRRGNRGPARTRGHRGAAGQYQDRRADQGSTARTWPRTEQAELSRAQGTIEKRLEGYRPCRVLPNSPSTTAD